MNFYESHVKASLDPRSVKRSTYPDSSRVIIVVRGGSLEHADEHMRVQYKVEAPIDAGIHVLICPKKEPQRSTTGTDGV
jgi:hypothetical protein